MESGIIVLSKVHQIIKIINYFYSTNFLVDLLLYVFLEGVFPLITLITYLHQWNAIDQ